MSPQELFRAGRLGDAVKSLNATVRDDPTDAKSRTFLFELLCFAGEYSRADKQLEILAQAGPNSEMGALLYRGALYAERNRQSLFADDMPIPDLQPGVASRHGILNEKEFHSFSDADPRLRGLELFAAGTYMLLPFEHIQSVHMEAPEKLRDLLWAPASIRTTPAFRGAELGAVLLPVLCPQSWQHADDNVKLGRLTVWEQAGNLAQDIPFGQKMWLVDDEEIPFLEVRTLVFHPYPVVS
jgi:type VI secretion system protein ImpE